MKWIALTLSLLPLFLFGQSEAVLIYESTSPYHSAAEPSIAINPANPAEIVAGSNTNFVHHSQDSGKTWQTKIISAEFGVWGDPCIVADSGGRFYYFHLSDPTGKNWTSAEFLDRIVCQYSDNGGTSWEHESFAGFNPPKDQDKEWAAVNLKTNEIALCWTQFDKYNGRDTAHKSNILFSLSENRGESWKEPVQINQLSGDCHDDDETTEGAVPAFGPNGEIYVAWAYNGQILFDYSLDGGETWQQEDLVIANQNVGWTMDIPGMSRSNGMPITACDVSDSPNKGAVYVCWGDKETDSTNADVFIAKSIDGGKTWSDRIRVNQDNGNRDQFLPWMSIDPITGTIYVLYYDRRRFPNTNTDVYLAWSEDGAETWQEKRLNKRPSLMTTSVSMGDYINISAYNGMVRPIWTEFHDGATSIWTALIQF